MHNIPVNKVFHAQMGRGLRAAGVKPEDIAVVAKGIMLAVNEDRPPSRALCGKVGAALIVEAYNEA